MFDVLTHKAPTDVDKDSYRLWQGGPFVACAHFRESASKQIYELTPQERSSDLTDWARIQPGFSPKTAEGW